MAQQSFDLYRFYDTGGRLLYVGISLTTIQRMAQHSVTQPWWSDVVGSTVEHLNTTDRREAERVERQAIIDERPIHNIIWNGRNSAKWLAGDGKRTKPKPPKLMPSESLPVEFDASAFPVKLLAPIQEAVDALGGALDNRIREGKEAPSRHEFVKAIDGIARSVCYGDCCSSCGEVRHPIAVRFEGPSGLRAAYHCLACNETWGCSWTRDLALLGALG